MVYIRETAVFGGISLALRGSAAFGGGKMKYTKFRAPRVPHWGRRRKKKSFLKKKLPQGHADSEYVLSFEIGQRESGFYSERTELQTDRITEPSSTILVYRCNGSLINLFYLNPLNSYTFSRAIKVEEINSRALCWKWTSLKSS